MNKIQQILLVLLSLLVFSCKKEETTQPIIEDIQCTGTFSDNFDNLTESIIGSGSDAHKQFVENGINKWFTSWWQQDGTWHYKLDNVIYDKQNGKMRFRYNRNNNDVSQPYVSGEINTGSSQDNRRFLFGTFEARMKVAKGSGVINTFFGYRPDPDDAHNKEIDIEIFGEEPTTWILFSCWLSRQSKTQVWFDTRSLGINDLSLDFHTYRFQWSLNEVKFYVDGHQAATISTNVPQIEIPIATGLWVYQQADGACWNNSYPCYPGFPLPLTNNSGEMVLDYVCINPLPTSTQFADDFNDGDFTNNPTWDLSPGGTGCWAPGTREVVNGEFHVRDMDSPGCGHSTMIESNLNMQVTDQTKVKFDLNPVFSDVRNGDGDAHYEYPAIVMLDLYDSGNKLLSLWFCYNYRGGVSTTTDTLIRVSFPYVPQNTWQRNQSFRVKDYFPNAVRIGKIYVGAMGWDYEAYFDNISVGSQ